jgi:putative cell wall-binding protein
MSSNHIFVLSIIAIVMFASVMRSRFRGRPKKTESDAELDSALEKIEQLEERIRVLERIITENRYDLKKEIDAL